ncbi:MAG: ABC transporter substrate-binding protein [Gammaproteobacteria bacterium]|nr:ABC transporter substrate-binding protein [Gammaproteobacteria bacterium]MCY4165170.1 ABC transporter substrate-binding protein [Gammaproteobacteria bacterium]MCY4256387.1 ABC transporter substrate-binding protein [Gammaproteobacteria bacterium]MCY4339846.1 ABC transporter substrate-binding protein [Gammaproteobacteria bacterium]
MTASPSNPQRSATRPWRLFPAIFLGLAVFTAAEAQPTVFTVFTADEERPEVESDRVLFGQSAALSGPAMALGTAMRSGIEAAFAEANRNGGVHGRRLELLSLDDGYEPEAAIQNVRALINEHQVFALIGSVGTPTARSSVPVASAAGVPYIAPFTGAPFLRDGQWRNVVNLRASYYQETEAMIAFLSGQGLNRVAVAYQDDSFGRAGFRGAQLALGRRGLSPVATAVYPRNTTAVKTTLLDVMEGNPQAVIIVGAPAPVAAFVNWTSKLGLDLVQMTTSFAGGNALIRNLSEQSLNEAGLLMTQVVPPLLGNALPIVAQYREALRQTAPNEEPGFVSLEGYLAGRMVIVAMEQSGEDPRRDQLLPMLRDAGRIDLGGFSLEFGAEDYQGSDAIYLTAVNPGGEYLPVPPAEARP